MCKRGLLMKMLQYILEACKGIPTVEFYWKFSCIGQQGGFVDWHCCLMARRSWVQIQVLSVESLHVLPVPVWVSSHHQSHVCLV